MEVSYFYIFLEIITFILLLSYVDINNILPVTYDLNNIMDHSYMYLCFLIMPILFLLMVPRSLIMDNKKVSKRIYISYILVSLVIFIKSIMMISIMGYSS